jgi:hypothetical protein
MLAMTTKYNGTHPANIAGDLRDIAKVLDGTKEAVRLREYANDVERLGRSAGVKFLGDR